MEQPHKRQRVSRACEQCRSKKIKCDGLLPTCGICASQMFDCVYKPITKKRGPPKGYIEAIESRLHRLEALIGSAVQEDDPRFRAIMTELNAPLLTANGEMIRPRKPVVYDSENTNAASVSTSSAAATSSMPLEEDLTLPPINRASSLDRASSGEPQENENAGNLSMDAGGQLRYYGKSSGYYMLRDSQNYRNGAFRFVSDRDDNKTMEQMMIDPFQLPPKDLADDLLDLYFENFYTFLPVLHKDSFLRAYHSRVEQEQPPRILLNAIFAVASRISPDMRVRTDPSKPDTAGDAYFERARMLLDFEFDNFKIHTVQAILLMSSHQNGALKSIRGWIYSGMAFRMSQNLGLHINCDSWDISGEEKEERKRVFWACFVIDRLSSAMHGRSPIIDERDCDAPYPKLNDVCDEGKGVQIMDTFLPMIRLAEILSSVLREIYTVRGRNLMKRMPSPDPLIARLDKSLNNWMAKLAPVARYRPPNTRNSEFAPTPTIALCQIHLMFYTTLILLHRPFIPGSKHTSKKASMSAFPSKDICTYAAHKILDIVVCLLQDSDNKIKRINNYTLYFMFTAGIIFINDAASSDPNVSLDSLDSRVATNKIINAMGAIESTWVTSTRHSNILGELAGLRDVNLNDTTRDYHHHQAKQQQQQQQQQPRAAIAVPNSPPIKDERYFTSSSSPSSLYGRLSSSMPSSNYFDHPSIDDHFSTSSVSPHAAMTDMPVVGANSPSPSATPFDPYNMAFFGVPASFDISEWNFYLNRMTQEQQQQQ
ncbi:hypothetical protein DM01DRAFT_1315788 [Hesseltinella vesiculosa]|uniref:Zn(2)-C6 fungal-type domain-containing protein n=1 Tax=Hesseltinella vesiculosa TaxID=101127 RepID=A0A1X2GXK4_9FUNG|nr:hypothetical protein DM01DRAFT_1315788 [Hesseltinella vesiculosa]